MALAIGCGQPNATFTTSEGTKGLPREARRGFEVEVNGEDVEISGIEDYLLENFGTPHELVAWLRLPVDFGGQKGVVGSQDSAEPASNLKVDVENGETITGAASLVWLSGDSAGETVKISGYDAETGVVKLDEKVTAAKGTTFIINPGRNLADGRRLYMTHCSHCHGTAGDGAGPTAEYLNPKPRDYRHGTFKFTSTKKDSRATTNDLKRIVKLGIPGTYMPSFMLLDGDELDTIIEYVRFLAMRGQYERLLVAEVADYSTEAIKSRVANGESKSDVIDELKDLMTSSLPTVSDDNATDIGKSWVNAELEESRVTPSVGRVEDTLASRARGRALFLSKDVNCANCHGPNGLGNGPQTEEYELDGGKPKALPGLYDDWGNIVKPRNLTTGIYRGGRRPIDIFCRIYSGIKGAKMTPYGGKIKDEEIWDIVNYVLSIPHEDSVSADAATTEQPVSKPATESEVAPSPEDAGE